MILKTLRRKSIQADSLEEFEHLPDDVYDRQKNTELQDVLWFLEHYGAPIGNVPEIPGRTFSFEEGVAKALLYARMNPTIARAFPVFIVRNVHHFFPFQRLKDAVTQTNQENTFGFFLDLTAILTGNARYSELAAQFPIHKRLEDFFLSMRQSKYRERLLIRNTPGIAQKWFFRINMRVESFQSTFEKFVSEKVSQHDTTENLA